ncbi:HpcH/HpaI aldolase family protein [Roseimicrobium gellanilyticum]|nr:aldolase/citrate lyase family protein [Roseimicrobium gellanilyticum]
MFRRSLLLSKIRSGGVARVCSTGNFIPFYPHLAKHAGFDAVWVCAEHRAWDPRQIEAMILQTRVADIDCVWRPPTQERAQLSRLLEDGATALMIPMVNTAEQAKRLVMATKYPPLGDRGLDGAGVDAEFWVNRDPDYIHKANTETALITQLESPEALENIDDIAAVPGVDIVFMGPGDLSLRLGCQPSIQDPVLRPAVERMAAACRKHGKPWGFPVGTAEDARIAVEMGCQFLNYGSDFASVLSYIGQCGRDLDALLGAGNGIGGTAVVVP